MQFTIDINGTQFTATGTQIADVNPAGKPFSVFTVDSLVHGGKDYAPFMKARDGQLRSTELESRKGELDLAWTEALTAYKAEHPDASDADIAAFKAYWLERPERRRLTSMRTDGLTATIIDANGEAHAAYFMRETDNRFRTYVPKAASVPADCPF